MSNFQTAQRGDREQVAPLGIGIVSALGAYILYEELEGPASTLLATYAVAWALIAVYCAISRNCSLVRIIFSALTFACIGALPLSVGSPIPSLILYLALPHLLGAISTGADRRYYVYLAFLALWLISASLLLFASLFIGPLLVFAPFFLVISALIACYRRRSSRPDAQLISTSLLAIFFLSILVLGAILAIINQRPLFDWRVVMAGAAASMALIVKWGGSLQLRYFNAGRRSPG